MVWKRLSADKTFAKIRDENVIYSKDSFQVEAVKKM
jgi:hypothetical protein|tara:strand:- start:308 stop:415 length:108 start_codon:yes stop_codon:yes gene_type:complete